MCKNPGFEGIKKIDAFINGTRQNVPEEVTAEMVPNFRFSLVTSVDVKMTFSAYELILSDKRHKFVAEDLESILLFTLKSLLFTL